MKELDHTIASLFVPDGLASDLALRRCSHMGVGAHQDDLEVMASQGILECIDNPESWFCGVTCTNGLGGLRNKEHEKAAELGHYGALVQLNRPSEEVKSRNKFGLIASLYHLLNAARPRVVYTHNPVDKQDTQVGVTIATLAAIREMPVSLRPEKLYGCDAERDLDCLDDEQKARPDVPHAMDLSPLILDEALCLREFVAKNVQSVEESVLDTLAKQL